MGTLRLAAPIPLPVRRNRFFRLTAAKIQDSQVPGRRVRFQFPLAKLALVVSRWSSFRMAIELPDGDRLNLADLCAGIAHLPFPHSAGFADLGSSYVPTRRERGLFIKHGLSGVSRNHRTPAH